MKVKDLIALLKKQNQESVVVMSTDEEGNGFSLFGTLEDCIYVPNGSWKGEIYLPELTENDKKLEYTEEDLYDGEDGQKAIVLYPTG